MAFKVPQLPDDLDPGTLTDGQVLAYDGATQRWVPTDDTSTYVPAQLLRENLAPNPAPLNPGGWNANATRYTVTRDSTETRRPGTESSKIVRNPASLDTTIALWNYTGQTSGSPATAHPVTPGDELTVSAYVRHDAPARAQLGALVWYDAGNNVLSTTNGDYTELTPGEFVRVHTTATVPAGAAKLAVAITIATLGGTVTGGEESWAQDLLIESGATVGGYFDGDTEAEGYEIRWAGTPHASPSQWWVPARGELPLLEWALSDAFDLTAITITDPATGMATTATVAWPDGTNGTFTGTVNTDHGAYDAYTITHPASGHQVIQAPVTRGPDGSVTSKPALTVGVI